jgi:hypothetical protein
MYIDVVFKQVRDYARKIEKVESTLHRLEEQAITQATLEDMRKELRTIMASII